MKLIWSRTAVADRREIRDYIVRDNAAAAIALDRVFAAKAQHLLDHPCLGCVGRVPDTRELVVHPNYLLIYDVTGELVRVLRLLHVARQWPPGQG